MEQFPYSPHSAWQVLPSVEWNRAAAAHLLRRVGFSATPQRVIEARERGLGRVINDILSEAARPTQLELLATNHATERRRLRAMMRETTDPDERRELQRQLRQANQQAFEQFAVEWFAFVRDEQNSAREKFVLFLQNIFVVARGKVNDTQYLIDHQNTLRNGASGTLPDLCKAVSRSAAMIQYLDLNRSEASAPNENFARELMELFTLGEGNYTESDIREAARAFTGYRIDGQGRFRFQRNLFDAEPKTIFGETRRFDGDGVIDAIFRQPASERFFIREFLRSYLGPRLPPEPYIAALGDRWRYDNFSLPELFRTVFQSRLFYDARYRGALIKSPVHFHVGLCQDLLIHPSPFARRLLAQQRGMGQDFQNPPNVRGWLEGTAWISATTVAARRSLVDSLFGRPPTQNLNADDAAALERADAAGRTPLVVDRPRLLQIGETEGEELAKHLTTYFLAGDPGEDFLREFARLLAGPDAPNAYQRLRSAIVALLQSPHYQLA